MNQKAEFDARLALIRQLLETAKPDLVKRERLRRLTILGLLQAKGVEVPNAEMLDSVALQMILDRHSSIRW
ncbi:MAG TPA: hypothetical protein VFQ39_07145 [Longimicrobium sp.]|nr:hypothetical protein [Longimicrobium sp.]